MTKSNQVIPVAKGDGIGPDIMNACLYILREAGARIEPRFVEIGKKVYLAGHTAGITEETWDILREYKVFYKAPITTPQGGRVQKPQYYNSQDARSLCQCAPCD